MTRHRSRSATSAARRAYGPPHADVSPIQTPVVHSPPQGDGLPVAPPRRTAAERHSTDAECAARLDHAVVTNPAAMDGRTTSASTLLRPSGQWLPRTGRAARGMTAGGRGGAALPTMVGTRTAALLVRRLKASRASAAASGYSKRGLPIGRPGILKGSLSSKSTIPAACG